MNEDLKRGFNAIASTAFGVRADEPGLDDLIEICPAPQKSKTGKSLLTANKMGFDILDNAKAQENWLVHELYNYITDGQPKIILDIGAGYGHLSLSALSKNKNIVISNDIAEEHLMEIRRRAIRDDLPLNHLYLNNKSFPNEIDLEDSSVDLIIAYRILHFLTAEEIEHGVVKMYKMLKENGKLFILVMAPQNKSFSEWLLPIYNNKWNLGNKFPGENLAVKEALPEQAYNLPEYLHVMDERPLRRVLEEHGFEVEVVDFVDMKYFGNIPHKRDGHESVGVIARKK